MTIYDALSQAAKREGWTPTKIAATVGKTEAAARRWLNGSAEMTASDYHLLRRVIPGFAELADRCIVEAA